jgi:lipoprotein NlpI
LKLATDDDKRTVARCYLGLDHVIRGRKDEALAHFRWVGEHGRVTFLEYTIALAELERLERGKK